MRILEEKVDQFGSLRSTAFDLCFEVNLINLL
jgi:hypothetical protein